MHLSNRGYWARRAEQELTLAQEAMDERVVRAHYELLGLCLDRLYPAAPDQGGSAPDRNAAAGI